MSALSLVLWFVVSEAVDLYFFSIKRVAVEVRGEHNFPKEAEEFMLPSWFPLSWIPRIATWVFIVLIWRSIGWWQAILCLVIPKILIVPWFPIPYRHVASLMERRLKLEHANGREDLAEALLSALRSTMTRMGY